MTYLSSVTDENYIQHNLARDIYPIEDISTIFEDRYEDPVEFLDPDMITRFRPKTQDISSLELRHIRLILL